MTAQTCGGNTLYFRYDDNDDTPIGFEYNGKEYYYVRNLQGDIIAILNSDGICIAEYSYDAWGNCTVTRDTEYIAHLNPLRYRGYYYDSDTNLYYLQSRYYDSNTGRFINADNAEILKNDVNISDEDCIVSYNLFEYCENNPVVNVDPTGEKKTKVATVVKKKYNYFIIYYNNKDSNFRKQAKYMKKNKYDSKDCKDIEVKTNADFKEAWNSIKNAKDIHLFLHGDPGMLCFYKQNMSYKDIGYLSYKDISGMVYLYACNGGTEISDGWSVAAKFAKLVKGKKVRAVVNGSVYYRAWNQIFARWPLTKQKNAYWADFYLKYGKKGKPDVICSKKVGGKGKMPA